MAKRETWAEITIIAAAAGFLIWLLLRQGTTSAQAAQNALFPPSSPAQPIPLDNSAFSIPAPVPGDLFNVNFNLTPNPAAPDLGLNVGSSGCSCASGSQADSTFGSNADLTAWLTNQAGAVLSDGLAAISGGWY